MLHMQFIDIPANGRLFALQFLNNISKGKKREREITTERKHFRVPLTRSVGLTSEIIRSFGAFSGPFAQDSLSWGALQAVAYVLAIKKVQKMNQTYGAKSVEPPFATITDPKTETMRTGYDNKLSCNMPGLYLYRPLQII